MCAFFASFFKKLFNCFISCIRYDELNSVIEGVLKSTLPNAQSSTTTNLPPASAMRKVGSMSSIGENVEVCLNS